MEHKDHDAYHSANYEIMKPWRKFHSRGNNVAQHQFVLELKFFDPSFNSDRFN
jgi:hypothetical protein